MSTDENVALETYCYPLSGDVSNANADELAPFAATAAEADIVGLGEATHGTREFFELKHRLVRHLVAERGFRTVAFETDFVNTLALDAYVRQGEGTAAEALGDVILQVWKTETVLATVEWLRAFNEGRPPDDRVRFHGISLSSPDNSADALRALLGRVGLSVPEQDGLDRLAETDVPEDEASREAFLDRGVAVADALGAHLDEHRPTDVEALSPREWTVARHLCAHLEQNCEWNRMRLATTGFDPEAFEQRDRLMAENVGWCLDTDPGDGVVVWAHNTHVKRGRFDMPHDWASGETMGEYLATEHGSEYRPYGTEFARGTYRAKADVDDPGRRESRAFTAAEPPTDTATVVLEAVDTPAAFFDVESAAEDGRPAEWFDRKRQLRTASALVDPDAGREQRVMATDLAASFDGLFVLDETSPSVPLADGG